MKRMMRKSRARVALNLEDVDQSLKDVSRVCGYFPVLPTKARRQKTNQAGRLTQIETELVELRERVGVLVRAVQEVNKRSHEILNEMRVNKTDRFAMAFSDSLRKLYAELLDVWYQAIHDGDSLAERHHA